ncbi:MAG TPA: YIP1 family protein, partial [Rubrobacter sp.]|nr:YIP1 family protein [Rubrobacter sp.]
MQEPPVGGTEGTNAGPGEFKPGDPLSSLWSVTRRVLLSPRRFFDALPPEAPAGVALLYFLVCYLIAVAMIAILAVLGVAAWFVLGAFTVFENPALPFGLLVLAGMVLLVLSVLGPAIFFAGVLIQHAIVVLVARHAQRGLRATARVLCYAAGTTLLLAWIPFVGVVAALYGCYLYQTGLRRVHGLSPARSGVAFLTLAIPTFALTVVLASVAYNAGQQVARGPTSYYFPPPEAQRELPPGTVGAATLMDGNEDQARVREARQASYADAAPPDRYHTEISIITADPEAGPRGVRGFARGAGGR